jgi:hypothetical protein
MCGTKIKIGMRLFGLVQKFAQYSVEDNSRRDIMIAYNVLVDAMTLVCDLFDVL